MHPRAQGLLRPGDPRLAPRRELALARDLVERLAPRDPEQARQRRRILAFMDTHPDALERTCLAGHLTASALLVDAAERRALLALHAKLGRWLQLGGHVDGDANLAAGALREAREESGLDAVGIDPMPIDLDVHVIPARTREPEHLHLDVRFLAFALDEAPPHRSDESLELRWVAPEELPSLEVDESVRRLFACVWPRLA